jgi:hypothetical protein
VIVSTYPDVAKDVGAKAAAYRRGDLLLEELQAAVWAAADQVVDVDEADDRSFLQAVESRLELIAFTTASQRVFDESMAVVDELDAWVAAYLARVTDTA